MSQIDGRQARIAIPPDAPVDPENLDHLMRVIGVRDWIPLLALGGLVLGAIIWSVLGRIPVQVEGRGALIYAPSSAGLAQVARLDAAEAGRLVEVRIRRGDVVRKGQVLARIGQPQTHSDLEAARARLAEEERADTRLRASEGPETHLALEARERRLARRTALAERRARLASLELEYRQRGEIASPVDGQVLEVSAFVGQVVAAGQSIGSVQMGRSGEPGEGLSAVAYFTIGEGKRVAPGMKVYVTPDTVSREEFGGIVGRVERVSAYPVSLLGAANLLSSEELVREVTAGQRQIEILAELEAIPGSASGYRWSSSSGPDQPVTAGTTATMRISVSEKAPLALVFRGLRL